MNRNCRPFLVCFLSMVLLNGLVHADDQTAETGKKRLEQLKRLAGEWTGKAEHDGTTLNAAATYRVTSAGSAVMETLFPGTDHEMITMYHLHGKDLILTHYCAAGNQPRMKASFGDNSKKIAFQFLDGTNLDPAKDMHMHEATVELIDDDHIRWEWTSYRDGKPAGTAKFDMKRSKPNTAPSGRPQ